MTEEQKEKLKNIKVVVTDVDGVHTSDHMIYFGPAEGKGTFDLVDGKTLHLQALNEEVYVGGKEGALEGYRFYSPDGIAVKECVRHDIPVLFISGRRSIPVERRAEGLGAAYLGGVKDKVGHIEKFARANGTDWEHVLMIGNDVQDLSALLLAGFSACTADSFKEVRDAVDYIAEKKGGEGAVREIIQRMFEVKGLWKEIVERERTLG